MTILVTGGAGFIGSNFIHFLLEKTENKVVNLDALTYAGNLNNLNSISSNNNYQFIEGSICNSDLVTQILNNHMIRSVVNFAAESHVDRSIHGPSEFVNTNIVGTFNLLESCLKYSRDSNTKNFRFLHVSTDEVYGTLKNDDLPFTEDHPFKPNSPYAASKASSDHLVRAYNKTYDLPTLITNCSNNYGPYQFPEKLIPLIILNALNHRPLPIYGDGKQIRDWLYVEDHCKAVYRVLSKGCLGETYNIGGLNEKTNIEVVEIICSYLDEIRPWDKNYNSLINYVKDRPGHDRRYSINAKKITKELNWMPEETFVTGIKKTINWYLDNMEWIEGVTSGSYKNWIKTQYDN